VPRRPVRSKFDFAQPVGFLEKTPLPFSGMPFAAPYLMCQNCIENPRDERFLT
jgi:hypothetical protein